MYKAFASVLDRISKGSNAQTLSGGLCIALDDSRFSLSGALLKSLAKSVATICNQLVSLKIDESDSTATFSLHAALQYFRLLVKQSIFDKSQGIRFVAPSLEKEVINSLLQKSNDHVQQTPEKTNSITLSQALEYTSYARIIKFDGKLHSLSKDCDSWSFDDCANFLLACSHQFEHNEKVTNSTEMKTCCESVLRKRLLPSNGAWRITNVCSAVSQSIKTFGLEVVNELDDENTISNGTTKSFSAEELISHVTLNLSSPDSNLRIASIQLLDSLDKPSSSLSTENAIATDRIPDDAEVQVLVHHLRESINSPHPNLKAFCSAFLYIMRVSRTLGGIGSRCVLVQEISRLVRQSEELPERILLLLAHFGLGSISYISEVTMGSRR